MNYLVQLFTFIVWVSGLVIAKGFWSTFFAFFFPPWGWYLVIERVLINMGWI